MTAQSMPAVTVASNGSGATALQPLLSGVNGIQIAVGAPVAIAGSVAPGVVTGNPPILLNINMNDIESKNL
jgi:hypothetical protein